MLRILENIQVGSLTGSGSESKQKVGSGYGSEKDHSGSAKLGESKTLKRTGSGGRKNFYLPGLLLVIGGAPLEVVPAAGDPVYVGEADLQQQRVHVSPDPHGLVQVHRYPTKTRYEVN